MPADPAARKTKRMLSLVAANSTFMFAKVFGMLRKCLPALSLLAMWNSALADWSVITTGDARAPTIYIGNWAAGPESHLVGMSILEDYSNLQRIAESPEPMLYKSAVRRFEYNCSDGKVRLASFVFYSDRMGTGPVVLGDSHTDSDWETVDGEADSHFDLACSKSRETGK
jgi:hypothetical protein